MSKNTGRSSTPKPASCAPSIPTATRIPVNPKAGGWPSTHSRQISGRNRFQAAPKKP